MASVQVLMPTAERGGSCYGMAGNEPEMLEHGCLFDGPFSSLRCHSVKTQFFTPGEAGAGGGESTLLLITARWCRHFTCA